MGMPYKNIHEFLEVKLADITHPTDAHIKALKSEYYKLWHRHYNRRRRLERKEFVLGFRSEHLQQIHAKRGNQSVSQYLYGCIFQNLADNNTPSHAPEQIQSLRKALLKAISHIEELLDSNDHPLLELVLDNLELVILQLSE